MPTTLTLNNPADYGNLMVSLQEAQAGNGSSVQIGTVEAGTITIVIPAA